MEGAGGSSDVYSNLIPGEGNAFNSVAEAVITLQTVSRGTYQKLDLSHEIFRKNAEPLWQLLHNRK